MSTPSEVIKAECAQGLDDKIGAIYVNYQEDRVAEQERNLEHESKIGVFRRLFADILMRPSYIESIEIPSLSMLREKFNAYSQAFDLVFDRVINLPHEGSDEIVDAFFGCTVGSTEGSEVRMLLMGLKPAVQSNWRAQEVREWNERNAGVTFEDIGVFAIAQSRIADHELVYCETNYSDNTTRILLDPRQIEKVIMTYQDVFNMLEYNPNLPAAELATSVFKDINPIGISLLLGYPLSSVLIHTLLEHQSPHARASHTQWIQSYWDSVRKIQS